MKLIANFVTIFFVICSFSGVILEETVLDENLKDMESILALIKPFSHFTLKSDLTCKNYLPGAEFLVVTKIEGDESGKRVPVPPDLDAYIRYQCRMYRDGIRPVPVDVKLQLDVIDKESGNSVMLVDINLRNGSGILIPGYIILFASLLFTFLSSLH